MMNLIKVLFISFLLCSLSIVGSAQSAETIYKEIKKSPEVKDKEREEEKKLEELKIPEDKLVTVESPTEEMSEFIFKPGTLWNLGLPYINKDFYLLEFGFVTAKKYRKFNFDYNAYVTASLFEDWVDRDDNLRAGGLGFKAGIIAPTQPWIPLLISGSLGYAKTVLHRNPILGRDTTAAGKKDMLLFEAGLMYKVDKYFVRFAYQLNNVKYFKRHTMITLGVVY